MNADDHLTEWSDEDFGRLIADVDDAVAAGRLCVVPAMDGSAALTVVGEPLPWVEEYEGQLSTLLDLAELGYGRASDLEVDAWAEAAPPSHPEQAHRWILMLQTAAPRLGAEWTAHRSGFDVVLGQVRTGVTIDTERRRILGQVTLRPFVPAGADRAAEPATEAPIVLTLTRNELLHLADRFRAAAAVLGSVARGEDEA